MKILNKKYKQFSLKSKYILLLGFLLILISVNHFNIAGDLLWNSNKQSDFNKLESKIRLSEIHPKIIIDNNWSDTKAAGICKGSGTPIDPYVIENYEIDGGGTSTCIDVLNSDVHFIIQNCTLFNSGIGANPFYHAGIRFYNVSNAKLFHNIIYNHPRTGIRLYYECDNNNITDNYVNNSYCGIYLRDGCHDNTILNNTSSNNTRWGIEFYINSDHNLVEGNFLISNSEDGIQLNDGCDNNTIFNNILNGNNLNGIRFITSCNQNEIINNKVLNNLGTGIEIQSSCDTNLIYNNLISINTVQAQDSGTNNQWDNGIIGNYWSDYGGLDSNDDGIGDTPYLVGGTAGSQDNYPIWNDGFNGNPILIDDTGAQNWAWARSKIWCSGSGKYSDPYLIENLVIDGGGTGTCIDILNSEVYFMIQNCTLYNAGVGTGPFFHAGIRFYNVSNGKLIKNNASNNLWSGIRIYYDCDNNTVIGNIASNNPDLGIYLRDGCNDNKVINNTCNGNGQWGIELYVDSDNNTLTRNMVKSNDKVGIQINSGCDNNIIYNNSLIDNVQSNAKDDGTNNQWDYNSLGNYWSDYGGVDADDDGIGDTPYLIPGSTGSTDDYPIWDDGYDGTPINIDEQASGIGAHNWTWASSQSWCSGTGTFSDPYILEHLNIDAESGEYGIKILNSNKYFRIRNCTIYNSGNTIDVDSCIKLYNTTNGQISYNELNNSDGGIYSILLIDSDENIIDHNNATNNNNIGIVLINSDNNSIYNNSASNNGQHGIYAKYSDLNNFSYNNLEQNTLDGFLIEWSCDNNTVFHNNISNNPGNGIRIKYRASSSNQYNIFSNNYISINQDVGIKIESSGNDNFIYQNYIIDNNIQSFDDGINNNWDNGNIGNYWSDYLGVDSNDDGIGDISYDNITGTAGSQDNYPIWEDGDDLPPYINILSPTTSELFGLLAPGFEVEIMDPNLDSMWYTIDGGLNNVTFVANETIDQNNWTSRSDGPITIIFYANDTSGNVNFDDVIVLKDTLSPIINIISPTPSQTFGISAPDFTVEVSDPNLDSMWYTIDGGLNNVSFVTNMTVDQDIWINLPDGPIILAFYANDTLGNLNSSQVVINKLIPILTIDIISPMVDQLFHSDAPDFIIEIGGGNTDIMWYTIDNGLNNFTFTSNETINQAAWISMSDGTITIKFFVNDTLGNIFSAEVSVNKDTEVPIISIIEPSLNDVFEFAPAYEISITESNLDTIWYTLDNGENNFTISGLTGIVNQERWNSLPNGYVTIRFFVNDTLGHLSFDDVIIVKDTPTTTSPTGIPGFDLFIIFGILSLITVVTIKLKFGKKIE